jgi:hypothetical protein
MKSSHCNLEYLSSPAFVSQDAYWSRVIYSGSGLTLGLAGKAARVELSVLLEKLINYGQKSIKIDTKGPML